MDELGLPTVSQPHVHVWRGLRVQLTPLAQGGAGFRMRRIGMSVDVDDPEEADDIPLPATLGPKHAGNAGERGDALGVRVRRLCAQISCMLVCFELLCVRV